MKSCPPKYSSKPLVELHNVKVHFSVRKGLFGSESIHAVDGVTLDIQTGEVVAVVGESGSGKTTLGRAALGLVNVTDGQVRFDNTEITALSQKEQKTFRRRAAAIFQDPFASIDPFMKAYDSVAEPLVIHGIGNERERRERVVQVLHDVRLRPAQEIADKYPDLLSGGQRQRLSIARALVLQPQFIVADEPVSMVDASSRAELLALLRELQERFNITFLYITHDIATARHFAQRIVVMYLGRVVEMGEATDVVRNPLHPYTQALIAAVPEPDPANRLNQRPSLPGEPPSPANAPSGCSFHPRCASFMAGRCELTTPRLREVKPNHFVACFLHEGSDAYQN
jgi:oligopeptide/dipeptide ABC transporter ATP-binding protein